LLVLLQCGLAAVFAYRLFLLSRTYRAVHPHKRLTTVYMIRVHRVCVFLMTALQCVRCIDPFCSHGIWSYYTMRFLSQAVTITIYFQYCTTTFVCMDTLYACALKRTPSWLAVVVSILPVSEVVVGISAIATQYVWGRQWSGAYMDFFVVASLAMNLIAYNVSGMLLVRILRRHQATGSGEEVSGSKSASPFELVISKTLRSMWLLSLPTMVAVVVYSYLGISNSNNLAEIPYDPQAPSWSVVATIFLQMTLGLLFTRTAWISKTALDAEILASVNGSSRESEKRSSGLASRSELKERAARMSQSPKPRPSENAPSRNSQAEPEVPVVAVTVVDVDQPDILPLPCTEMIVLPEVLPPTAEIV